MLVNRVSTETCKSSYITFVWILIDNILVFIFLVIKPLGFPTDKKLILRFITINWPFLGFFTFWCSFSPLDSVQHSRYRCLGLSEETCYPLHAYTTNCYPLNAYTTNCYPLNAYTTKIDYANIDFYFIWIRQNKFTKSLLQWMEASMINPIALKMY